MNPMMIEWFYDQFMQGFSGRPDPQDPEGKEVLAEYAEASNLFFATFTPQQRNLYFRFEEACSAVSAQREKQLFFEVFAFIWQILR